jgi:hypothetical protein
VETLAGFILERGSDFTVPTELAEVADTIAINDGRRHAQSQAED